MTEPAHPSRDHSLFLGHFERGKTLFEQRRFVDAEHELEEAYLIRPRDAKVLNLLGLVYFRQHKLEKAEEVYRKLAGESPEANTLFYNLGLIYFKLDRLEESEAAFLKAQELSAVGHPKISFYLGSIYERQRRFQDAIYQYRQAGANVMAQRIEGRVASSAPATPPRPRVKPDTDDTAEFKTTEIHDILGRREALARQPAPLGPSVLAPGAPVDPTDTARFQVRDARVKPQTQPVRRLPPGEPASGEPFRLLQPNLVEVSFTGKLFFKQGTLYSYSGNLTFWVKEKRPGGTPALVIVTGAGKVLLLEKDRQISFLHVADQPVFVEPAHLLACEDTLTPRYEPFGAAPAAEFLVLEGHGMAAVSLSGRPIHLSVTPQYPVSLPSSSVVSWTGRLTPSLVEDEQLREVILSGEGQTRPLVRLAGSGHVLVEQSPD
jgi:tetratricopeptide (TPR) repeat protein